MTLSDRLTHINGTLSELDVAWSRIAPEIQARIDSKTLQLIGENNEQTRGAIKCLRELMNLPDTLQAERSGIEAALLEQSSAD